MPLLPTFNERSDFELEIELLDVDDLPIVPVTSFFHIYCVTNGQEVREWTAFSVDANGLGTIPVTAGDSAIVDDTNETEEKVVTVQGTYAGTKEFTDEYRFKIKNLLKIPKV